MASLNVKGTVHKISLYADDVLLYLVVWSIVYNNLDTYQVLR